MSNTHLVLITGASGQLGRELQRCSWPTGWKIVPCTRDELDLADFAAVASAVARRKWSAVINAAAYTAVDAAEDDSIGAWTLNTLAPAALAQACRTAEIPLVHLSTDYVFDGAKAGAWSTADAPSPLNVYGASKLGGEIAIRASGVRHVILRTAWLQSPYGSNFVKTMLRLAEQRSTISVVDDQRGSPTIAADLAQTVMKITMRLLTDAHAPGGLFHFSNAGTATWAELAEETFRQSALRGGPQAVVKRIKSCEYSTRAARPANSVLSHDELRAAYQIEPRAWQLALEDLLDKLIGAKR